MVKRHKDFLHVLAKRCCLFLIGVLLLLGDIPSCSAACTQFTFTNGQFNPDKPSYSASEVVTLNCDTGYDLTGDTSLTCDGTNWGGNIPSCSIVQCAPDSVASMAITPSQATFNYSESVTYTCNTGWQHASGNLVCAFVQCAPGSVANTAITPSQAIVNYIESVTYTCDTGWQHASGNLVRTCQSDGTWNGTTPSCSIVQCAPDSAITPSQMIVNYSESVTYTCDTGWQHASGNLVRTCQSDGTWNGTTPSCSIVQCSRDSVANTVITPSQAIFNYSQSVTYTCDTGWQHASGNLVRTCQIDGIWNGSTPSCSIVQCAPDSADYTAITPSQAIVNYSESVTYTCDTGWQHANGNLVRTCQSDGTWNGTTPSCLIVQCSPDSVTNTVITPSQAIFNYSQSVTYSCDTGWQHASGNLVRTCQIDGIWNGSTPSCSIVQCAHDSVVNTTITPSQAIFNYGESVTYACITGWQYASGNLERTCQSTGAWNGSTPSCSIVQCAPDSVTNTAISPSQAIFNYSESVTYTCNTGWRHASGNLVRSCQSGGTWNGTTPTCSLVTCTPDSVPDSSMTPNQATINYSDSVTYACDYGYERTSGSLTRTCNATGNWDSAAPVCTIITCTPDAVANSNKTPDQATYVHNTSVTYACNTGYEYSSGDLTRTCNVDKTWTGNTPVCIIKTCIDPGNGVHAIRSSTLGTYNYGETVNYTCDTGFELNSGSVSIRCQADETWSDTPAVCTIIQCNAPVSVTYGTVTPDQPIYNYSDVISYTCITGYEITSGNPARTCQATAAFDGPAPVCTIVKCPQDVIPFSTIIPSLVLHDYNTQCTVACDLGYNMTGDATRTCLETKLWNGTTPVCTVAACVSDPFIPNVTYEFGVMFTRVCNFGDYISAGDQNRTCQTDGTWTGSTSVCSLVRCNFPGTITGSTYTPISTLYDFNTAITYTCDAAYNHTAGDLALTCQADFSWSGNAPTCTRIGCYQEDAVYMTTVPNQNVHLFGEVITYSCIVGYNHTTGDLLRTCETTGFWSGTLPQCVIVTCTVPSPPVHSTIAPGSVEVNYNTDITYTCDLGYNVTSGDAVRKCNESGNFNGEEANCTLVTCDPPDVIANGTYTPVQTFHNYSDSVVYSCDVGFKELSGDFTRTCNELAVWTGTIPVCKIHECSRPSESFTAPTPDQTLYPYLMDVTQACITGYNHTSGDLTRTCNATGYWDGTPPVCTIIECPEPDPVFMGLHSPNQSVYVYQNNLTYACEVGWEITSGDSTRTCTENTTWTGDAPVCTIKICPAPASVANSTLTPDETEYNYSTVITYVCDTGYELTHGSLTRTCQDSKTFSGPDTVCSIKQCAYVSVGNATAIPNQAAYDYLTTVTYTCNTGWNHTAGELTLTCSHTKAWNYTLPTCTIIECPEPDPVFMGIHTPNQSVYVYQDTLTYGCEVGWEITSGDSTRTCTENTTWTGDAPVCTIKICPAPASVANSTLTPDETEYNYSTVITYVCDTGYELTQGSLTRTCQDSKTFFGPDTVCSIKQCAYVSVGNATANPNQAAYDYLATVTYTCNTGWNHTAGELTLTCSHTKAWNYTFPTCTIVECDTPETIDNATFAPVQSVYVYQNTAVYTCDIGYEMTTGTPTLTCTETGFWDISAPNCTIKECPVPAAVSFSTHDLVSTKYVYGDTITWTCDTGYELTEGDLVRTCQDDKMFDGTPPNCTIKTCDAIPIDHGQITNTQAKYDYDTQINYVCILGYNNTGGDLIRTCNASADWNGTLPECTIVKCPLPSAPDFSSHSPIQGEYVYLDTINYTCNLGYELTSGSAGRQCQHTSYWDATAPNCTIIQCPVPPVGDFNTYTPVEAEYVWNDTVVHTCDLGYNFSTGDLVRSCHHDKTWTGSVPDCVIVTCDIIDVGNATMTPAAGARTEFDYLTNVTYGCNRGFKLVSGDLVRTCNYTGLWSGDTPNCTIVTCPPPSAISYTSYTPVKSIYIWDTDINYVCYPAYHYVGGLTRITCNESEVFPPSGMDCSVEHYFQLNVNEPSISWMNMTVNETVIVFDFDGMCQYPSTLTPTGPTHSVVATANSVIVDVQTPSSTQWGTYTLTFMPHATEYAARTWNSVTHTIFYGEEVLGLQLFLDNTEQLFLEVGVNHKFYVTTTQGTDVTVEWDMGNGIHSETNVFTLEFVVDEINYTYPGPGIFSVNATGWNLLSSQSDVHIVNVIYAVNNMTFTVDNDTQTTTSTAQFSLDVLASANIPFDAMSYVITYTHNALLTSTTDTGSDKILIGDTLPITYPHSHLFPVQGEYNASVVVTNLFGTLSFLIKMNIWDDLRPLTVEFVNGVGKYITNTTMEIMFNNVPPNGFKYSIDYGDGTIVSDSADSLYYSAYSLNTFTHIFTQPAMYLVTWTAENGLYSRSETFWVKIQNRVPNSNYTLMPVGLKYPWINLQAMAIELNITLDTGIPLPTNATCIFYPDDGNSETSDLEYIGPLFEYSHNYLIEGIFNSSYNCSNDVSQHEYVFNLEVDKYEANYMSVLYATEVPMNKSDSVTVFYNIDNGGFALIPLQVYLDWDFVNNQTNVIYDRVTYSNVHGTRGDFTITLTVSANVTGTNNVLYLPIRIGIMRFEYNETIQYIDTTLVRYTMYGVLGNPTTYTVNFDDTSPIENCTSTDFNGCYIDHYCPTWGYKTVTVVANNGTFVEWDDINVTCENPIVDLYIDIPLIIPIPDGKTDMYLRIAPTDLYLPWLVCEINMGDPIMRDTYNSEQWNITLATPFVFPFQYISLGRPLISVFCYNLISNITLNQTVTITNEDFLFSGLFDRTYSQEESPVLISSMKETDFINRLVILALATQKTRLNIWNTTATTNEANLNRHGLLFTRGMTEEKKYLIILQVAFMEEPNNIIFEPTYVLVVEPPPHVDIVGNRRREAVRGPTTVDAATLSYDPAFFDPLTFAWSCSSYSASNFDDAENQHNSGGAAGSCSTTSNNGAGIVVYDTSGASHSHYVVTVTGSNGRTLSSAFTQIIEIIPSIASEISIVCRINCLSKAAVTSDLMLVPSVQDNCPATFAWTLHRKGASSYSHQITLNAVNSVIGNRSLTILGNKLSPGTWYLVSLTQDGGTPAYYEFVTNLPPKDGACTIKNYDEFLLPKGESLHLEANVADADLYNSTANMEQFNISCTNWVDEGFTLNTFTNNEPLIYYFYTAFSSDEDQRQILYFDPGQTSNLVTFQVGDVDRDYRATIVVRIMDIFGDYAELRFSLRSSPPFVTDDFLALTMDQQLANITTYVDHFDDELKKDNVSFDYRSLSRKVQGITSVYNAIDLTDDIHDITLSPEDLLSLGYKRDANGSLITWTEYWQLIVEVTDSSFSSKLIQEGEFYGEIIRNSILTWPPTKRMTIISIETISRALNASLAMKDYTNVTAAKYSADCAEIMARDLATHVKDRTFPNTEQIWSATVGIRDLIRSILSALQTVLTPNLPEDPTVDEMRNYLEYMRIFKSTEELLTEPLSLQEQTFLAQKQLQKYYLQKYIKSEASKYALPKVTNALHSLCDVMEGLSYFGNDEKFLENDYVYVSTIIAPASHLDDAIVTRPRTAIELTSLTPTLPDPCGASEVVLRSIVFKHNPYFWGQFGDRITSYVPVFRMTGATLSDTQVTYRLENAEEPMCIDQTPTYIPEDPNKMIYILFDRMHGEDDILMFIRPNATELVYQLYFNKDEKPSVDENKYMYTTELKKDKWTAEDGFKLLVKSVDFPTTGKIWIGLRPLLTDNSLDPDLLSRFFCANVTSVNCLSWVPDPLDVPNFHWDKTKCEVSELSSLKETVCVCQKNVGGEPMTVGSTFYVPQNKIDFKNEGDEVTVYGRDPVIYMVAAILALYFALVVWAWRADIMDQYKWSVSLQCDNDIADSYFYIIRVYTGLRTGAGTSSKIGYVIVGEDNDSGIRILDDEMHIGFERGSVRTFVMSSRRYMGDLLCMRIWHDDSGGMNSSWFLNKITVTDMKSGNGYQFSVDSWFDYDRGDTHVDRVLNACRMSEVGTSFKDMASYTFCESHLWLSVYMVSQRSNFTRIQRLSCLLGLVYLSMIFITLFLRVPSTSLGMDQVIIGSLRFSLENFDTAMVAATIVTVLITVVSFFFKNAESPDNPNDVNSNFRKAYRALNDKIKFDKTVVGTQFVPPAEEAVAHNYHFLPHFCVYIAWIILTGCVVTASYLMIEFSESWELVRSEEWMTTVIVASMASILILEPLKVVLILIIYQLFCKKAYENPDPDIDEDSLKDITKHNSASLTVGPQFDDLIEKPVRPDEEMLQANKIERLKNHEILKIFMSLAIFSGVLYVVYTISFQSRDQRSFYLKNNVEQTFDFGDEVKDLQSFTRWLNTTFIENYFSSTHYGATADPSTPKILTQDLVNVRVGPARLRQMRVKGDKCQGPLGKNKTCYNAYKDSKAVDKDYCISWEPEPCFVSEKSTFFSSPAWQYVSPEEVWGFPTVATYSTYAGGGYFMKLDVNREVCANIFTELVQKNWFDRQTRAVMVEFTLYNVNTNLFVYSKFVAEFPEVGGFIKYVDIQVFRLYLHSGDNGTFVLIMEFTFFILTLTATVMMGYEMISDARTYFKSVWNWLDILALTMAYMTISMYIYKIFIIKKTTAIFVEDKNAYVGFENLAFYDFVTNSAHSVLVFLLSIRVSRILGYSGKINEMAEVITSAGSDLLGFLVIFGISYFAYVTYGTLLFGKQTAKYKDLFSSYGTLTEAIIGKNRLSYIIAAKPGYAEFYYFTFVLFVLLTLATMAAAILNFSISKVREEHMKIKSDATIVELLFERIGRCLSFLSGGKNKAPPRKRKDSDAELNDILLDLHQFIQNISPSGKPSDKYKVDNNPVNSRSPLGGKEPFNRDEAVSVSAIAPKFS